jgi:hypothetical protein
MEPPHGSKKKSTRRILAASHSNTDPSERKRHAMPEKASIERNILIYFRRLGLNKK